MSVTIATLADAHRHGHRIDAWCIRCETGRPVDLAMALADDRSGPRQDTRW